MEAAYYELTNIFYWLNLYFIKCLINMTLLFKFWCIEMISRFLRFFLFPMHFNKFNESTVNNRKWQQISAFFRIKFAIHKCGEWSLGNEAILECCHCQEGTEYIDRNFHFSNLLLVNPTIPLYESKTLKMHTSRSTKLRQP